MGESDLSFVSPGLFHILAFGMVFYLEEKQRHIFWFLSFSSRADIKPREGGEDGCILCTSRIHAVQGQGTCCA